MKCTIWTFGNPEPVSLLNDVCQVHCASTDVLLLGILFFHQSSPITGVSIGKSRDLRTIHSWREKHFRVRRGTERFTKEKQYYQREKLISSRMSSTTKRSNDASKSSFEPPKQKKRQCFEVLANLRTGLDLRTGPPYCENTNLRTGLDQWTRKIKDKWAITRAPTIRSPVLSTP